MNAGTTNDGWYDWRFDAASGWWQQMYTAAADAVASQISSASANWVDGKQFGYGLFALPRGLLMGGAAPEAGYYTFPTSAQSKSPRIKSGRRNIGDRRVIANRAVPGGYLEQVVTKAGFEPEQIWKAGASYSAGNTSGTQKYVGNTVAPSDPSLDYVFVASTTGTSDAATEPSWALHLDGVPFDDHVGGTLQWTFLGPRAAWNNCTPIQDRTALTQTESQSLWTGVPTVRTIKASGTFTDTATHDLITYPLPLGAVVQLDCTVGAIQSDGAAAATFTLRGAWSLVAGGGPNVIDAVSVTPGSANPGTWSANLILTMANEILVEVQETVTATQITWSCVLKAQESYAIVAPDPADVHLMVWYRADSLAGGRVSDWVDASANVNDAVQADPTLCPAYYASDPNFNGQASVVFDGTTTVLGSTATTDLSAGYTVFVVSRIDVAQNFNGLFRYATAAGAADVNALALYAAADGNIVWALAEPATWVWQSNDAPMGLGRVCSTCITSDGATFAIRINGVDTTANGATSGALATPGAGLSIFPGAGYYASPALNGDIAEIIVYDTTLTSAQIEQIEAYLRARYAHY